MTVVLERSLTESESLGFVPKKECAQKGVERECLRLIT